MAVNDTLQLSVKGTAGGQDHIHTLHLRLIDGTIADGDIIDMWRTNCRGTYRELFCNVDSPCVLYRCAQVCGSIPLRAPAEQAEAAPNIVGSIDPASSGDGGNPLPSYVASILSLRTASAGKSYRGRAYIGGLSEARASGNTLTTNQTNRLQAYVDDLLDTFGSPYLGGVGLVVHSRKLAAVPGTDCQDSSTLVTGILVRPVLGTMRSRLTGHGS